MYSGSPIDFSVYTERRSPLFEPDGRVSGERFDYVKTALVVSDAVRQRLLAIPNLARLRILDGPHMIRCLDYNHRPIPPDRTYWYVHYGPKDCPPQIGPG